jgi:hypothetical protein
MQKFSFLLAFVATFFLGCTATAAGADCGCAPAAPAVEAPVAVEEAPAAGPVATAPVASEAPVVEPVASEAAPAAAVVVESH